MSDAFSSNSGVSTILSSCNTNDFGESEEDVVSMSGHSVTQFSLSGHPPVTPFPLNGGETLNGGDASESDGSVVSFTMDVVE
jgi:hypothetical protein